MVAHLRHHLGFPRRFGHCPRLINRARQWFLAINVLAMPHRGHRYDGVQVVGGAHHHGVNALVLVEHRAEILVALRVRVLLEDMGGVL